MDKMENNLKAAAPVVAFSAWSGTGKTTIIERLIACLKEKGLRVAAVKHDAHSFEIDREGKDSWRFANAGADITVISSKEKTALIEQRSLSFDQILSQIHDVDIILAEGFNQKDLPKIGISRRATGEGFRLPAEQYIAVVTDDPSPTIPDTIPTLALDDTEGLAQFLIRYFSL